MQNAIWLKDTPSALATATVREGHCIIRNSLVAQPGLRSRRMDISNLVLDFNE